jgi:hypothetical protein
MGGDMREKAQKVKDPKAPYSEWQLEIRKTIRDSLKRPLLILRGRHRELRKENDRLLQLINKNLETRQSFIDQAPDEKSPMIAINMLVVEGLFLLEKRMNLSRPKHFKAIHMALTVAERLTASDMGKKINGVVYGPNDIAILSAIEKFGASYVKEEQEF